MNGKVFISHSSVDKEVALKLVTEIERHGIKCWISSRDIPPSEHHARMIPSVIESASAFLLLFSQNALESSEIPKELALAAKYKKRIVPARIEDIVPTGSFAYELSDKQFIDLFVDFNNKVAELSAFLAETIGSPLPLLQETVQKQRHSNRNKRRLAYLSTGLVGCVAITGAIWQFGIVDQPKQNAHNEIAVVPAVQPPRNEVETQVAPLPAVSPPVSSGMRDTNHPRVPPTSPVESAQKPESDKRIDRPVAPPSRPAVIVQSTSPVTAPGGRYELTRENKSTLPIFVYSAAEDDRNQRVAKTLKLALQDAGFATTDNKKTAALEVASTVLGVDAPTMDTSHTFVQWNSVARLDVKARWTGSGPVLLAEEIAESGGSKEREEAQINALRASISSAVKRLDGLAR